MTSLTGKFERDILYLAQGKVPILSCGKEIGKLDYEGEEHEKLTDDDIAKLASALNNNDCFVGPLELQKNNLTDLAALHLGKALCRKGANNITKLTLTDNNFTGKAGQFIGEALRSNPEYPLYKLWFENVFLEEDGLVRIIEAVNANKNILKLHCGYITDHGLEVLSGLLAENTSLEEIVFQETTDHQKYWTEAGRGSFTRMLKRYTQLKKVKAVSHREEKDEAAKLFKQEVDFYTQQKSDAYRKLKQMRKRGESCDNTSMFNNLLENIEKRDKNEEMPVRKFFANTFGNMLNDAIFQLKKKQEKEPENVELMTHEGMVKFVAFYMKDNLPDGELIKAHSDKEEDDN